jgi:hypothetical protein
MTDFPVECPHGQPVNRYQTFDCRECWFETFVRMWERGELAFFLGGEDFANETRSRHHPERLPDAQEA